MTDVSPTRPADSSPTRPTLSGSFGMAASTHWLASGAAMSVLERGGNAFDAAVAAGLVLQVVEPHLNGPGGDLPALFATAHDPTPTVLCGQGPVPAAATPSAFTDLGLTLVPGAGPLAAVVPGAMDAWLLLLRDHGTMRLGDVASYAVGLAQDGHRLLPGVGRTVAAVQELFTRAWPTSAALWLTDGRAPEAGQWHRNPTWAGVLSRLADVAGAGSRERGIDAARQEWREGFVAEAVVEFQRQAWEDSSGSAHAGLLTAADLAGWRATYEPAVTARFRGVQVAKTGPWGQGPTLLLALGILDGYDDPALDLDTADGVHLVTEALKLALADREAWFGDDPDVPMTDLLEAPYTASRRALIGSRASAGLRPGSPGGRPPRLPDLDALHASGDAGAETGEPTVGRHGETRGDTCHLDVVDRWGNMISATPSGGWLQSSPAMPDLGFCLGSRAQMTWLQPGLASTITPGRRPRTTLSPTLVLRDGVPVMACGTPGGDQQDQWQLTFLLRHLVQGLPLQRAIDAPTFHTTSFPGSFYPRGMEPAGLVIEDRWPADVLDDLRGRGHEVTVSGGWTLGRLSAVARDPATGELSAAANARGDQGYAAGR